MVRARRNCTNTSDFLVESANIQKRLHTRGYPMWLLKQAPGESTHKREDQHRIPSVNNQKKPIVFSMSYSIEYKQICGIIKQYILLLVNDPSMESALKDGYLCVARRAPTLRQELSPSLFSYSGDKHKPIFLQYKDTFPCGHKRRVCC